MVTMIFKTEREILRVIINIIGCILCAIILIAGYKHAFRDKYSYIIKPSSCILRLFILALCCGVWAFFFIVMSNIFAFK